MAISSVQGVSQVGESMDPPSERFERSIPEQEERMKELLDSFKTEMMERFQEQEERIGRQEEKNVEQDLKIARQSATISKLEETIAEQQKTIEDQNRTVQIIAKNQEDSHRAVKAGKISLTTLGESSNTTATSTARPPITPQDSLLFITGGYDATSRLSSTESYPSSSDCSPPSLPLTRVAHTTFVTSEPTALVATCGGVANYSPTKSCLVLDPTNRRWNESRMGSLTMLREHAAAATLDHIGVFILGGEASNSAGTSEFLAAGTMQWQRGPALPVDMDYPCSVEITPNSFLIIHGRDIREFDAAYAGPTSSEGWHDDGRWPSLKTSRIYQPGCAKIGQKVIIAGGYNGGSLSSTEVLDLVNRRISTGEEMATPRHVFHLAAIVSAREKIFALGGTDGSTNLNFVEEWVEESSTWKAANELSEGRYSFGAVAAPKALVC